MNERTFHGDISRLRSPERMARLEVDRVVELCLSDNAIQSMLDVGTGSGIFAEAFAARGLRVGGVDANAEMIRTAQQYVPDGDFRHAAMEELPFANGTFDLVFLGHVLHEADDLHKALGEAHRVARVRVAVLEWPYRQEEQGPPLEHRLNPTAVMQLANEIGFPKMQVQALRHMNLFLFDRG